MRRIWVSDRFYKLLKKWYEEFNKNFSLKYYKKRMTFVDFTDFIVKFELLTLDRSRLLSAHINRRRRQKEFDFDFDDLITI